MKFIHCFSRELKNKLLDNGYKLVSDNNGLYIFENSTKLRFDFNAIDKKQFVLTNKLIF